MAVTIERAATFIPTISKVLLKFSSSCPIYFLLEVLSYVGDRGLLLLIVTFSVLYNVPRFFELQIKVKREK